MSELKDQYGIKDFSSYQEVRGYNTNLYTIVYEDGTSIDGFLLPQANSNYYRFVDITNSYIWHELFHSQKDFEERYAKFAALTKNMEKR